MVRIISFLIDAHLVKACPVPLGVGNTRSGRKRLIISFLLNWQPLNNSKKNLSGNECGSCIQIDISVELKYSNPVLKCGGIMTIQTTYTNARSNLAKLFDEVTQNQEIVIINRRGKEDVALISASELESLTETARLLRSPRNASRLLKALNRALSGSEPATGIDELKTEVGLEKG
jgi:antitoxin YefM